MANAARLAVEDYTASHPDENIAFILEDDGADPKRAISAYEKLKSVDRADLIMPVSTFAIGALRDRVNRQKDLTFILGNEPYEPADDYIFMFTPAAVPAQHGLGEEVARNHPQGSILVVTSQNETFLRFARAVRAGSTGRADIVEIPNGADFRSLALMIKSRNPVALVFNGLPRESAALLRELRRLSFSAFLYFDDSIANSSSEFETVLGDLGMIRNARILNLTSQMDSGFGQRYSKRFGSDPRLWTDYAYDATTLALKLKSKSVNEARAWLLSNDYHGVSGTIRFDRNGLRVADFRVIPLKEHPAFSGKL